MPRGERPSAGMLIFVRTKLENGVLRPTVCCEWLDLGNFVNLYGYKTTQREWLGA